MASSASGALADFSKKPTGYKVAVFAGAGALIGLLYWQFLLSPLRTERNELEMTKQSLEADSARLDRELVDYRKLSERSAQLREMIEQNQKALPTGAELPAFFETLNRKIAEAGAEVKKWEYKKEMPVETFIKVPLEIELTGTFYQLKRFFSSLLPREDASATDGATPERERIITIENLKITVPQGRSPDLLLTANFRASTFRQEREDGVDELIPGASGAAPKSGLKGVKPRVEGAIDQGAARGGNPQGGL